MERRNDEFLQGCWARRFAQFWPDWKELFGVFCCCADGDRFVSLGECANLKKFLAQCKSEVRFSVGVRSVVNLAGLLGFRLGTSFGGNFGVGDVFLLTALLQRTT